jgi:iron complex transport system substrate-binding protein
LTGWPTRRGAAAGLVAAAVAARARAQAPPRRVVSLNPCLDAILVRVADRGQIAALSRYSRDPDSSSIVTVAATLPFTYGSAEEVVALAPDLVLLDIFTPPASLAALRRLGVRTAVFGGVDSLAESLAQVARVAAAVGRPDRGKALIARIRAAVAAAAPPPGAPALTALVFQANGFVSAEGTLVDEMIRSAGFTNVAGRYGLKRSGPVSLERLVADPPQVLLAGEPRPGAPAWADRILEHPALRVVAPRMHRAVFPQRLLYCGGPVLVEMAATLARARRDVLEARA